MQSTRAKLSPSLKRKYGLKKAQVYDRIFFLTPEAFLTIDQNK